MSEHGQRPEEHDPPGALARAIERSLEPWLERCVVTTAAAQLGACPPELADVAASTARRVAPSIADAVGQFLALDVDAQRGTPLAMLRSAVVHPTEVLRAAGVPPVERDEFLRQTFPDDVYGLVPASWSDLGPEVQEPGIVWGAWKAGVVLSRRRAGEPSEPPDDASGRSAERSGDAVSQSAEPESLVSRPSAPVTTRVVGRGGAA